MQVYVYANLENNGLDPLAVHGDVGVDARFLAAPTSLTPPADNAHHLVSVVCRGAARVTLTGALVLLAGTEHATEQRSVVVAGRVAVDLADLLGVDAVELGGEVAANGMNIAPSTQPYCLAISHPLGSLRFWQVYWLDITSH